MRTPFSRNRSVALVALAVLASLLAAFPVGAQDAPAQDEAAQDTPVGELAIFRVTVETQADIDGLVDGGYDLVEARGDDYLLVIGDGDVADALIAEGYTVAIDQVLPTLEPEVSLAAYFGGYRTYDEHVAHLQAVAADYPGLAQLVDYGDSWRKVNGVPGGNDLQAICLTNRQAGDCALSPNSAKPRAVIMASLHARELAPAEVAYRLIDDLVEGYGVDADLSMILDTTEVWVIPVANPDGREIVEEGGNAPYLQRKNANDTLGFCANPPTAGNHAGVDLNRNASYQWGGIGTSTNPCSAVYRGVSAASEPEQVALESLFAQLWPDQNTSPASPVPDSARGTFITIHSFSDLILLPPGAGGVTPNDAQLRDLAFRMSSYNGYVTGTGPEILYGVTGATDDWVYGQLGVPAFTYEIGPASGPCSGFTPVYSCVDSTLYPRNRDALLYSLRVAGSPYASPAGPTTDEVSDPGTVPQGSAFTLSATVDDNALGNARGSVGRPSAQAVAGAEYYLAVAPWDGGTGVAMSAQDGSFNEASEIATAQVDTGDLPAGRHAVYVRSRDSAGNWGPFVATSVTVEGGAQPASISGIVTEPNGAGASGITVDLFNQNADGSRGSWITLATTGPEGGFTFSPDAGCYVLTFVAPSGQVFTNGSQWLNVPRCVAAGEQVTDIEANLSGPAASASIAGSVLKAEVGVPGAEVDIFTANADGSRGAWQQKDVTDADGAYRFDLQPGCYVITFIAPAGERFPGDRQWINADRCVTDGENATGLNISLASDGAGGTISGSVTRAGNGAAFVVVDLFVAGADGSRGAWRGSWSTDESGDFAIPDLNGCYVLTFIAPAGETFTNGSQWFNSTACVEVGETVTGIDAVLAP